MANIHWGDSSLEGIGKGVGDNVSIINVLLCLIKPSDLLINDKNLPSHYEAIFESLK